MGLSLLSLCSAMTKIITVPWPLSEVFRPESPRLPQAFRQSFQLCFCGPV